MCEVAKVIDSTCNTIFDTKNPGEKEKRIDRFLIYRCPYPSGVTRCDSSTSAGSPTGSNGYVVVGWASRAFRLCSFAYR